MISLNRKKLTGIFFIFAYSFDPDPTTRHTWFSLIIGGGFTYLSLYAVNQTQVQRLLTVKDLKASQKAMWLNWPILSCLSLSTSLSGLAIYYLYHSCDPLLQGRVSSRDQVSPKDTYGLFTNNVIRFFRDFSHNVVLGGYNV